MDFVKILAGFSKTLRNKVKSLKVLVLKIPGGGNTTEGTFWRPKLDRTKIAVGTFHWLKLGEGKWSDILATRFVLEILATLFYDIYKFMFSIIR